MKGVKLTGPVYKYEYFNRSSFLIVPKPFVSTHRSMSDNNLYTDFLYGEDIAIAGMGFSHTVKDERTAIEVTVVGKDRKGIVADITNFIFKNGGNIEQINQNVVRGLFGMHLEASFQKSIDRKDLDEGLKYLSKKLQMEIKVHYQEANRIKNVAILVSKEDHCLTAILDSNRKNEFGANIEVIIGTENTLKSIADNYGIPFYTVDNPDQHEAETHVLQLIEKYNIDVIVLARYMRILTPNFVWRYPNRIINIHPSLLPAFPGAYAYVQAYERGAKIVGCTAHFVTEDLDQGPIICQESFKISESDTLESIKRKGRILEGKTLLEAIKLYLEGRLEVYWRRVHIKDESSLTSRASDM